MPPYRLQDRWQRKAAEEPGFFEGGFERGKHFLLPLFRALWLCEVVQQLLLLSCQVLHDLLWSGALQMPLQNSLKKQIPLQVNQRCKLKGAYKSQHTFITPLICEQYLRAPILTSWGEQLCGQICISCQENVIYPKTLQHRKLMLSPKWLFSSIPTTYGRKEYLELSDKPINCQLAGWCGQHWALCSWTDCHSLEAGAHWEQVPSCPAAF